MIARALGPYEHYGALPDSPLGARFRSARDGRDVVVETTSIRGDAEMFERAVRRIELMASVEHPHLVPVLDAGIDGDLLYLVTPAPERTAADIGAVGLDAVEVISLAARGLAHLHEHGVLHRDIQLAHIGWFDGVVRLGGLGLSDREADGTRGVGPIGAVTTMAPSIVLGRRASLGSDVYSLGATLHLLATGVAVHPVRPQSLADRICRIGSEAPVIDRRLDPILHDLVVAALAVDGHDTDDLVSPVLGQLTGVSRSPVQSEGGAQ